MVIWKCSITSGLVVVRDTRRLQQAGGVLRHPPKPGPQPLPSQLAGLARPSTARPTPAAECCTPPHLSASSGPGAHPCSPSRQRCPKYPRPWHAREPSPATFCQSCLRKSPPAPHPAAVGNCSDRLTALSRSGSDHREQTQKQPLRASAHRAPERSVCGRDTRRTRVGTLCVCRV